MKLSGTFSPLKLKNGHDLFSVENELSSVFPPFFRRYVLNKTGKYDPDTPNAKLLDLKSTHLQHVPQT